MLSRFMSPTERPTSFAPLKATNVLLSETLNAPSSAFSLSKSAFNTVRDANSGSPRSGVRIRAWT